MITTVTSTTISSITTANISTITTIGVLAVITLIGLLMTKEFASVGVSNKAKMLARCCDVAILPLTLVFATSVVMKVVEILA